MWERHRVLEEMDVSFYKWPVEWASSESQHVASPTWLSSSTPKKNEFTPGSETLNTEQLNIYKTVWRGAPPVSFWILHELASTVNQRDQLSAAQADQTLTRGFSFACMCHLCQAARLDLATGKDRMLCPPEQWYPSHSTAASLPSSWPVA